MQPLRIIIEVERMKILNIGSMNLDYVYSLDTIVRPGETVSARALKTVPGGKGLNQSVALAKAGANVFHAGCVGNGGELLAELLKNSGVDTRYIMKVDAPQGNAIIQVENSGNNSIIVYGGSNRCLTKAQIDETLDAFEKGDLLILQNEINELPYIVEAAYARGLVTVLNPSPFNEVIKECDLSHLGWLIMNETETEALTGCADAVSAWEKLHAAYPRLKAVITLGTDGAYAFDGEARVFMPAFKVKAVDTTAAGDTFTGYFFASLTRGESLERAMELAATASAISVTRPGASVSVPELTEVLNAKL